MNHRIILAALIVALASCSGKKERPDDTLVEATPEAEPEPTFEHPDPGPILQRTSGAIEPRRQPPASATVDAVQRTRHASFVRFRADSTIGIASQITEFRVAADDVHGVAVRLIPVSKGDAVVVRFAAAEPPASFTVSWSQTPTVGQNAAGAIGRFDVSLPDDVEADGTLEEAFWRSASADFAPGRRGEPFFEFASNRLNLLRTDPDGTAIRRRSRTEVERLMDLYSGMSSVDEALQADRGLRLRGARAERTIPIGEVEGVGVAPHPWKEMIADLETKPVIEPLASVVPADMAYVHFDDLRTFVRLVSDLSEWASPFAQWVESRPGASHFLSRYEHQLVVERSGMAETLGHVAVKEMAIVTGDPFVREGTDVSMLFRVKNRTALLAALEGFEANARRRRPDLKQTTWKEGEFEVERIFTPDLEVNQHRVEIDDVIVISNSAGAVRHLLAARDQTSPMPTLADVGDFRYMRARYPWGDDAEDGFVFLGDAFVARAVSPALKILESRRVAARADLQAVNHGALLFGWMEGRRPTGAKELGESRYLDADEFAHADGSAITFESDRGARSALGSVRQLTPIRDLKIEKITEAERDAYARFRRTYQDYWRRYIDPIAARISRTDDGSEIAIDARMLPLIDATEYDELLEVVGRQKVLRPDIDAGAQWTFAVGKDAKLREMLDGMARSTLSQSVGVGWLGQWVMAGVADRSGLWDLSLLTGQVPQAETGLTPAWRRVTDAQRQALGNFPIYVGAHVTNKVGLAAVLTGLKKWVEDAAPGMVSWGQTEPYRDVPIVTIRGTDSATPRDMPGALALHYTTVADVFIASLDRATLELLIDRVLAGKSARPATGPPSDVAPVDAQTFVDVRPGEGGWLAKSLIGLAERGVIQNHQRSLAAWRVLRRGLPGAKLDEPGTRRLGLAYLGYEPRNPNGGAFQTTDDGRVTHSLYGDAVAPKFPEIPVEGSPITRVFGRLDRLAMSLDFEREGDHRALRSALQWSWKDGE